MAYIIGGAYNENQSKPVFLTEASKKVFDADNNRVNEMMGFVPGAMLFHPTIGIKAPAPSEIYHYNTKLTVSQFHPIMYGQGGYLFSQTAVDVLEKLEPNTHQFFPVKITAKDGEPEEEYFFLNVCVQLKSLNFEKTTGAAKQSVNEERINMACGFEYLIHSLSTLPKLDEPYAYYAHPEKIKGHALWFEYGFILSGHLFISEELREAFQKIGVFDGGVELRYKVGEE